MMLCIFTVTSVSASDLNATDDVITAVNTVDEISVNEKTEILSVNYTPKTFDEIQTAVDSASDGDTVILDGYYQFNSTVTVYKQLNFVGINDATVDGNKNVGLFIVSDNGVTFNNITFKNGNSANDKGGAIYFIKNVDGGYVMNCNFVGNSALGGGAIYFAKGGNIVNCSFINNIGISSAMTGGAVFF
ncbi:MAG: hypothetical protein UIB65_05265 [Methanobrevibacter sp.]|nr:hypothetical protein [Methanobrevibacter sp.]